MSTPSTSDDTVQPELRKRKKTTDEVNFSDLEDTLSAETIEVLRAKVPLVKAKCTTDRSRYPSESKPVYLRVKKLLHKKILLTAHIIKVDEALAEGSFPNAINFKCAPYGANGDMKYVTSWAEITSKCKKELTTLYMAKLKGQYRDVKNEIQLTLLTR
jgi:hypothetical protein